jgi:beta-glucanase (GH16 family)
MLLKFVCLICWLINITFGGWIDPDTSNEFKFVKSHTDGRKYELVFSDEFNTNGRHFHDGSDPRWTAINKNDYTNFALHYYNDNLVNTSNGYLNIATIVEDISFTAPNKKGLDPKKITKNYQSGMIQGWNKFCFTGGIV